MQHDLQLRAAARAHFACQHPLVLMRFEEAEERRTTAFLKAVEAAQDEAIEIHNLFARTNQLVLL